MHSSFRVSRRWRIAVAGATMLWASVVSAWALDISGTYADKGTVVPTEPAHTPAEVSLHALLSLDFEPVRGSIRYETTDTLTLSQMASVIDVQVFDRNGGAAWRGRWPYQYGALPTGDPVVVLKLRSNSSTDVAYLFAFDLIEGGKLLQVSITRLAPTVFGVSAQPFGRYLFYRVPSS